MIIGVDSVVDIRMGGQSSIKTIWTVNSTASQVFLPKTTTTAASQIRDEALPETLGHEPIDDRVETAEKQTNQ